VAGEKQLPYGPELWNDSRLLAPLNLQGVSRKRHSSTSGLVKKSSARPRFPSGAEALIHSRRFTARLKAAPFQN